MSTLVFVAVLALRCEQATDFGDGDRVVGNVHDISLMKLGFSHVALEDPRRFTRGVGRGDRAQGDTDRIQTFLAERVFSRQANTNERAREFDRLQVTRHSRLTERLNQPLSRRTFTLNLTSQLFDLGLADVAQNFVHDCFVVDRLGVAKLGRRRRRVVFPTRTFRHHLRLFNLQMQYPQLDLEREKNLMNHISKE